MKKGYCRKGVVVRFYSSHSAKHFGLMIKYYICTV